jgi:TolB protein
LPESVRTRVWLAVVVLSLGAFAGEASPVAWGTFPGGNGLIAFTRTTAAGSSIAVVEPDRSGFRTLIENAQEPAWSADGRSIAFVRKSSRGDWDIFIANADGSGARELPIPGHDEHNPAWSPDGTQLAFEEYPPGQIYVMNLDGRRKRKLTNDQDLYIDNESISAAGHPDWSPDGRSILYDTTEHAYLIHPDGSGHVTLHGHGEDGDWSPDGTHIASLEGRCPPTNAGYEWICIESADGTSAHQLTHGDEADWSPDGSELVVSRADFKTENGDLYIINADGSGLRPLVRGAASTWDPSWQPTATGP